MNYRPPLRYYYRHYLLIILFNSLYLQNESRYVLMIKGAPEVIIDRCSTLQMNGEDPIEMTDQYRLETQVRMKKITFYSDCSIVYLMIVGRFNSYFWNTFNLIFDSNNFLSILRSSFFR